MDADARIPKNAGKRGQIDLISLFGEHDCASVKSQSHTELRSEDHAKSLRRRLQGDPLGAMPDGVQVTRSGIATARVGSPR